MSSLRIARRNAAALLAGLAAFSLAAPPAAFAQDPPRPITQAPDPVMGALQQPFKDIGVVRDKVPDNLIAADAKPYDLSRQDSCTAIEAEISGLDQSLGPDVDVPLPPDKLQPKKYVGAAIGNAVGLPFRGVVRTLSGAEKRDRQKRQAIEAGMARRAYLKGVAHGQGCGASVPVTIAEEVTAQEPERGAAAAHASAPPRIAEEVAVRTP